MPYTVAKRYILSYRKAASDHGHPLTHLELMVKMKKVDKVFKILNNCIEVRELQR